MLNRQCVLWAVLLGVLAGGATWGCGRRDDRPRPVDTPVEVVATIRPLALLLDELTADVPDDVVTVRSILDGSVSPHGFEAAPADRRRLAEADLVVCNGLGLDDWARRAGRDGTVVVVFADVVGEHGGSGHHHEHEHDDGHGHGHDHGHAADPHLWLDPALVGALVESLGDALAGRLEAAGEPSAAAQVREAAVERRAAVERVDQRFAETLAAFDGRSIITFHDVLGRVAGRYGLDVAAVLRPIESMEPAPGDIRQAVEAIDAHGIPAVFIEPQFSPAAAERIADRAGVRLVRIDPMGAEAASWTALMDDLLAGLVEGLRREPS